MFLIETLIPTKLVETIDGNVRAKDHASEKDVAITIQLSLAEVRDLYLATELAIRDAIKRGGYLMGALSFMRLAIDLDGIKTAGEMERARRNEANREPLKVPSFVDPADKFIDNQIKAMKKVDLKAKRVRPKDMRGIPRISK